MAKRQRTHTQATNWHDKAETEAEQPTKSHQTKKRAGKVWAMKKIEQQQVECAAA